MTRQVVILVDHGTPDAPSSPPLARLASILAGRAGVRVIAAHLVGEPSVTDAAARAAGEGAERVIVLPCLLSDGHHTRRTLPELLAEARRRHPDVAFELAEPLGIDDRLAGILLDRLRGRLAERTPA